MDQPPEPPLEIFTGFWSDLKPHVERDAVFVVDQDLNLSEVAGKVVIDEVETVSGWIEGGSMRRPTVDELERWDQTPTLGFRFVIVQPYVLIQTQGH